MATKTKEQLQAEANKEIDDAKPLFKSVNNERIEFTDDDYAQAKIDLGNSKWNDQQFGYVENRVEQYKPITEQLDMMYWDKVNGTATWQDHIAKVKADNPKPS